jgi:YVTN family beta-propeller protein
MLPRHSHPQTLRPLLSLTFILSLALLWLAGPRATETAHAQAAPAQYRNFEGPQVHPLTLTPDGTRLLAVNTPNATLSIFQLVSGTPVLTAEIPVGLEPVSVTARSDREAWVANWMSDSVSIVDLSTGNVTRTLDVGDEPTDVLFAGPNNGKAFVCVSGGVSTVPGTVTATLDKLGRGLVKVFDASNPTAAPQVLTIFGKQPRALARDAAGTRVFVSVFESGNQTTVVPEPSVTAGGGLPPPNPSMDAALPPAPATSLIVKWNGSNWVDELNRSWNSVIPYKLADLDLAVIDASTQTPVLSGEVHGVGTNNGNMVFDPTLNRLAVVNLESTNQVRFEPNVSGRFQQSRVSFLSAQPGASPSVISAVDLNPQVDLSGPGSDSERAASLALPSDIARASDGTFYVAATSSGRVGVLDASGGVQARVAVGAGPTGLALDEARSRLYVLNRFDETLSIVSTTSRGELARVSLGTNPEPLAVRAGRKSLYSSDLSRHGTVSCASCHLNGHRDGLAWDLGNPLGQVDHVQNGGAAFDLHPMKGPMMTQTLRGISQNTPLHWRGDRAALDSFNPAFVSLLGGPRQLNAQEMSDFSAFVSSLTFPPNPNQDIGTLNRIDVQLRGGFTFFNNELLFGSFNGQRANCSTCHVLTNFRPGTNNLLIAKASLHEAQDFKTPQLRGLYQKVGLNRTDTSQQGLITGYGFAHDGTFDTLFNFMLAPQFNFSNAGSTAVADDWRREITELLLTLDSGTAPTVGMLRTATTDNKSSSDLTTTANLLASEAAKGNCDMIARGLYGGAPRSFLRLPDGTFQPDTLSEAPVTLQTLLAAAGAGAELSFLGVPPGEGRLFALDRDGNGVLNDDEPHTSVGLTGRVVDAGGVGLAGVVVTLSGTQSATTVTDAAGRYAFNYLSTTGTHIVTPQRTATQFTPSSRTFAAPTWNLSADFITSSTSNASDATPFFVSRHYSDFLARDPDASGLQFWTNDIESCGSSDACREVHRVNVSAAFFLSIEFKETGYLVYRAYKASFGDLPGKPVPVTFQQLMTDTQRVGRNVVVNQGNWQQQLETNKQSFFLGWVQRPAFVARYAGMSAADFVDTLNQNTGGVLSADERNTLVNQLGANNTTAGRAAIVRAVAENATLQQREINKAFVLMQYFGYLRRNPDDPPDADFTGYNSWLTKLNAFNGNFVQAEMVKAFITSIEYRQRFGQ